MRIAFMKDMKLSMTCHQKRDESFDMFEFKNI